jgi:hypothetical protein
MKLDLKRFSENNIKVSNFMKIHAVGAELLHTDRQTAGQTQQC